jgi:hypothetical protein
MKQSEEYRSRHSMEVPGKSTEVPGKSTEVPGKSTEVPGGCTEVPDNCQELPWSRKKSLYGCHCWVRGSFVITKERLALFMERCWLFG